MVIRAGIEPAADWEDGRQAIRFDSLGEVPQHRAGETNSEFPPTVKTPASPGLRPGANGFRGFATHRGGGGVGGASNDTGRETEKARWGRSAGAGFITTNTSGGHSGVIWPEFSSFAPWHCRANTPASKTTFRSVSA